MLEEQEIYREVYKAILSAKASIKLQEVSANGDVEALLQMVSALSPDVVLVSIRKLAADLLGGLQQIRADYPKFGIVLLLTFCNTQDAELLRQLMIKGEAGVALFMKNSLDQVDQLCSAILAAHEGQIVLDPLLANLVLGGKPECPFLKQLTARELEILKLLSAGYTNLAIARALFIDSKTVEHHLNNIYSKLKADTSFSEKHLRVSAARLYLETMGEIHCQDDVMALPAAGLRSIDSERQGKPIGRSLSGRITPA